MIEIINIDEKEKWDNIVKSIHNYDIYYLSGYAISLMNNGDGTPILIHYKESENTFGYCVFMKREVNRIENLDSVLNSKYYDCTTPYGYGGFIFSSDNFNKKVFLKALEEVMESINVISVFFRFNPLLNNQEYLDPLITIEHKGYTVNIELSPSFDSVWDNFHSKNRNVIRKAIKSDVKIEESNDFESFIDIYNQTMKNNQADSYFFFNKEYYKAIYENLSNHYKIFNAVSNDKIISSAIFFYTRDYIQYHLSGSLLEYRKLSPSNLLLSKVAEWGCNNGFRSFHLGGGLGGNKDSLYKFKKSFNKNSPDLNFYIGKWVVNKAIYNKLSTLTNQDNSEIGDFFPIYRKKR